MISQLERRRTVKSKVNLPCTLGDFTMGVNTDGEEMSPGSTVADGPEPTKMACEFEQQPGNEKQVPEEAVCDTRIHNQKEADGIMARSETIKQDLPINPNTDLTDEEEYTLLYKAALKGHLDSVDELISNGANLDKPSKGGLTPLHAASQGGHEDIVDYPILQGANINVECEMGQTLLHTAARKGHLNIMEYLIQHGSDLNKCDDKGETPFNAALDSGNLEAVKYLIVKGAKQNRYDGITPLYAASQYGHLDLVKFFISEGADVNGENDSGRIPLHGSATDGHMEVLDYLIQQRSDVNKADPKGWTPFNAAVEYGHLEAVKYLIAKGAKQNRYDGMTPLYAASQYGHLDLVKFFIYEGAEVNEEHDEGMIPLHGAAADGHMEVLDYLIQQRSDVNKGNQKGWTPFNAAVEYGHLETVKYLIAKGAKQNRYDGMTPLYAATRFGHLDLVKFFVSKGADINEENDSGSIALHGASIQGNLELMEYLMQQGSDVNKNNHTGWTPFNATVQYGHLESVKYLIAKGAKQNRYDGMTPLYAASQSGHLELVKFFISEGADVNEELDNGGIPLHGAATNVHMKVLEYLIQQGSDVNKKEHTGWTPFLAAVRKGHLEAVKLLMANGAQGTSIHGMTPLYIATQYDHVDVVKHLVSKGHNVNERSECGRSPLHAACYNGRNDVVKYLVEHNANINEQDEDGWTPFHAAAQEGHRELVEFLAMNGADITVKDIDGMTPLHAAVQEGHQNVAESLAMNGADITAKDIYGMTPLQAAKQGGHAKIVEYLTIHAIRGGDTLSEDRSDSRYGRSQRDSQRHRTSSNFGKQLENEDTYGSGGKTHIKSPEKPFASEQSSDSAPADGMDGYSLVDANEDDINAIHRECLPTMPAVVGKLGKDESNPFVSARLKITEKSATTAEQKQVNGSKGSVPIDRESRASRDRAGKNCLAPYDGLTNGFTDGRDHNAFSLLNGHLSWKRGGFDQSSLHTTETNCHSYEETVPKCHTILEEPFSSMNARNDQRTTENDEKFERPVLTNPLADEDHHKSKDGNPSSTTRNSTHSERKGKKKSRSVDTLYSSLLVLMHSLLHVIIPLVFILAGSPVLVAGSATTDRVTLHAGRNSVIPFNLTWPSVDGSSVDASYTLRFESKPVPFCIDGFFVVDGFKSPSQLPRFAASVEKLATSLCLNLFIERADTLDKDMYELIVIQESLRKTFRMEVLVQIPPGPAKCFLTISENNNYPYEVHCQATTGSMQSTLTCYQYSQRVEVKGDVADNDQVTRGVFLLPDHSPFSCCSHDVTSEVNITMCNDFEWPPSNNNISRPTIDLIENTEQASNTLVESQVDSGTCKPCMASSVSLTIGLMIYLFLC